MDIDLQSSTGTCISVNLDVFSQGFTMVQKASLLLII